MAEMLSKRWKKVITIFTFFALLVLIYVSRHQIADTFSRVLEVNIFLLLLLVLFQVLKNHSYAKLYQNLFEILGKKLKYRPMFNTSLEINFVNNVFPTAGLTGFSYFGLTMKQFGVNAGKATLVHMMRFIGVFVSFQVLIFLGLIALAIEGQVSSFVILIASSLATLIIVGAILLTYIVGSKKRIDSFFTWITKMINRIIQVVRPKHPETINIHSSRKMFFDLHEDYKIIKKNYKKLGPWFFHSLSANAFEIASIYVIYVALGNIVNPGAVILAYVIANFAGFISILPGGVGIYEGLMVGVLVATGVPPGVSIPATVMYRILTSAMQLPFGYYFYQQTINRPGWENPK